jgi:hypothetical protein
VGVSGTVIEAMKLRPRLKGDIMSLLKLVFGCQSLLAE